MMRKITAMLLVVVLMVVMASSALAARTTWDIDYNGEGYTLTVSGFASSADANIQTLCRDGCVKVRAGGRIGTTGVWEYSAYSVGVSSASATVVPSHDVFYSARGEYNINNGGYTTSRSIAAT